MRRWVDLTIGAACSSVGVAAAFYFERLVVRPACACRRAGGSAPACDSALTPDWCAPQFTVANALVGAEILLAPLADALVRRGAATRAEIARSSAARSVRYAICAAGVWYQLVGSGRAGMPGSLRLALVAPLALESWLARLAMAMRATS